MTAQIQWLTMCGLIVTAIAGCGRAHANLETPETFPFVQCTVELNGKPVQDAIVEFHSADNESLKITSNFDPESDCYRFITTEEGTKIAGIPAGEYTVSIRAQKGGKTRIPAKYAKATSSGLTAVIKDGENRLAPFELTP